MNIHDWTIQDAIAERVRQEDLVRWAQRPDPVVPEEVLKKELPSQVWSPTAKYAFGNGIIRFAHSIIA